MEGHSPVQGPAALYHTGFSQFLPGLAPYGPARNSFLPHGNAPDSGKRSDWRGNYPANHTEDEKEDLLNLDGEKVYDAAFGTRLRKALEYEYPYESDTGLYAMVSVSELKNRAR